MILTAMYHILSTGVIWTPCDLLQVDMPLELQEKHLQKALKRAAQLLISQGIVSAEAVSLSLPGSA
jgi:transposase